MFRTFGNTLSLLGTSLAVLRREGLMLFPLTAGLSLLVVFLYVLFAFQYGGTFERVAGGMKVLPADLIFLGLAYLAASFVIAYFSASLVAALHYRLMGGTPDFRFGMEAANDRLGALAVWSAIACTVGLVLRPLASIGGRLGRVGGLCTQLLSGWAVFLVLPVMMAEGAAPMDAMRRSTELFSRTWGRQLEGNFGFGLLYWATAGVTAVLAGVVMLAGASPAIGVVTGMMVFALAASTLKCLELVFVVALYNYARLGETDGSFAEPELRNAYVFRKAKGSFVQTPGRPRAAA